MDRFLGCLFLSVFPFFNFNFCGVISLSAESIFLFIHLDYILLGTGGITPGSDSCCKCIAYVFIFSMDSSRPCKIPMTAAHQRMLAARSDLPERNRFISSLLN